MLRDKYGSCSKGMLRRGKQWCTINPSVEQSACFFSMSTSTSHFTGRLARAVIDHGVNRLSDHPGSVRRSTGSMHHRLCKLVERLVLPHLSRPPPPTYAGEQGKVGIFTSFPKQLLRTLYNHGDYTQCGCGGDTFIFRLYSSFNHPSRPDAFCLRKPQTMSMSITCNPFPPRPPGSYHNGAKCVPRRFSIRW